MLFRFLRGSGTAGLAAIRPVTAAGARAPADRHRAVRRSKASCASAGSRGGKIRRNATLDFARNRIRHQLLPQLAAEWNPGIVETLAHTADFSLAEEAYWEAEIERLAALHLSAGAGGVLFSAAVLGDLPLAAARRLVRHAIQLAKGDLRGVNFRHIARVLELAAGPAGTGRTQLPGLEVRRSFDWLRFRNPGRA